MTGAIDAEEKPAEILEDVIWRHRGDQGRAEDGQPEALRRTRSAATRSPSGSARPAPARPSSRSRWRSRRSSAREVSRIILTRPAVEAGERLGFLPGDIQAKVDPYLRPLFDALYDMLDPEQVLTYFDRGVIEVAPLAFMRGPGAAVSEPGADAGWLPCRSASLRVGDLVIGSDGRPTPVLGVYPQGRKEVFRVRTQDGASTLCLRRAPLARLHAPMTAAAGSPVGSSQTREMIGSLRAAHQRRYELPLVSAPAEFPPREVADGPVRARPAARRRLPDDNDDAQLLDRAIRSWQSRSRRRLTGSSSGAKGDVDYVLRNREGQPWRRRSSPTR